MSLLEMLSAGSTGVIVPPPDPEPNPTPTGWPTTSDPNILALRPTGRTVIASVTGTPGDSMADLYNEVAAASAAAEASGTPYGPSAPERSLVILLPPGTYQGGFTGGDWISIVGTSGNPDDVIITSNTAAADGTYHPTGVCYAEGVTFKAVHGSVSPKYAAHIGGSSATTFVNCHFDVRTADSGTNAGTVGMDGRLGTYLTFYGCKFSDITGLSRNHGMNLHSGGLGALVSKISFINCIAPAGVGYDGATGDEVYVIGGTIGGNFYVNSGTKVYTNLANTVSGGATDITRGHTTWPVPDLGDKGFVDYWLAYYYPDVSRTFGATIKQVAAVTDRAPMTPVLNRIYYCPVPLDTTLLVNRMGWWVRSGAGKSFKWNGESNAGLTHPSPVPPDPLPGFFGTPRTLGDGEMLLALDVQRVQYRGKSPVWAIAQFLDVTGLSIDGSAELPGMIDCYYSDNGGTTKVKATAGTPFPLAHAAQVR